MGDRFSVSVELVSTKRFLSMPITAQVIYFHLLANSIGGYVGNWKALLKRVGCKMVDINTLKQNSFISILDDGRLYIDDWDFHNKV